MVYITINLLTGNIFLNMNGTHSNHQKCATDTLWPRTMKHYNVTI